MLRFLFLLLCLAPLSAQTDQPNAEALLKKLEQQVNQFARSGGRGSTRQAIQDSIKAMDPQLGDDPRYLLLKEKIYSYFGDQVSAKAAFDKVADEHLVHGLHLFNRLQARMEGDLDKCLPLIRRMADAEGDFLPRWVHDAFAAGFLPEIAPHYQTPEHQKLLEGLGDPNYPKVAQVSAGLRAYVAALKVRDDADALAKIAADFPKGERARSGRYQLLLHRLMNRHQQLKPMAREMRKALVLDLGQRIDGVKPTSRAQQETLMWSRYLLAYACYLEAGEFRRAGDLINAETWYRRAAEVAPSARFQNMFGSERHFLGGPYEFQTILARYLESNNQHRAALEAWLPVAVQDGNFKSEIERLFPKSGVSGDFETWWVKAFEKDLPAAPEFSLQTPDGQQTVDLKSYRGKWVLVDFWGTWCGPCRVETPQIEALNKDIAAAENPPGALLTIASRDQPNSVKAYMNRGKYTYDVVMADNDVLRNYKVPHFPYKVMITPGGKFYKMDARTWRADAYLRLLGQAPGKNDKGDSRELEKRLMAIAEKNKATLGVGHPETLNTLTQLGNLLRNTEQFAEAETIDRTILEIRIKKFGREDHETVNARYRLARALAGQEKWDEAFVETDAALEVWRKTKGPNHPHTIFLVKGKADFYTQRGMHKEAAALYQPRYDHYRTNHGPSHPATLELGLALGASLAESGRAEEALAVLREVCDEAGRNWGDDHKLALEATVHMIDALAALKRTKEAADMAERYARLTRFTYGALDERHLTAKARAAELGAGG